MIFNQQDVKVSEFFNDYIIFDQQDVRVSQ